MSIEEQVQAATARHNELVAVLTQTDHAPPDLRQHEAYISDLEGQLKTVNDRLVALERTRKQDLKDHVKYRDSVVRRFAYKASGRKEKFAEKAAKEEKDYFDGLRETQSNEDTKRQLEEWLSSAQTVRGGLIGEVERHRGAQNGLDELYNSIFTGPSPNFPIEDRLEQESNDALQQYENTRQRVEAESRAHDLLRQADRTLRQGLDHMQSALSYSTWDMWGGGTMTDMMERNELSGADRAWSAAKMSVLEAIHVCPAVQPLPEVRVAAGSLMSDVFFDNIFTDMAFHDKIKQSDAEMRRAYAVLKQEGDKSNERLQGSQQELRGREQQLERSRVALQTRRTEIFREVNARRQ